MNLEKIKADIMAAYQVKDDAARIPKYATQFSFSGKGLVIRIPVYECELIPRPLLLLICFAVGEADPRFVGKNNEIEWMLQLH